MSVITSVNITETTKFPAADGDELQVLLFATFYLLSAFLLAVVIMVKIQMARVRFGELSVLLMKRHTGTLFNAVITKKRMVGKKWRVYGMKYVITSRRRFMKRYGTKMRTLKKQETINDNRKDGESGNVGEEQLCSPRVDRMVIRNGADYREQDEHATHQLRKNQEGNLVDLSPGPEVVEKMQDKKHIEQKKEYGACLSVYMGIAACREEMERKKHRAVIDKIASRDLYGCGDRGDAADSIPDPELKEDHLIGGETRLASDRDELVIEDASRMTGEENTKGGGNGSIAPELQAKCYGEHAGDLIPDPELKEEHINGGGTRLASDRDELGLEDASRMTGEENAKGGGNGSIAPELQAKCYGEHAGDLIPDLELKEEHINGGGTRLASDRDELGLENASRMTGEENANGGGNGSIAPELRARRYGTKMRTLKKQETVNDNQKDDESGNVGKERLSSPRVDRMIIRNDADYKEQDEHATDQLRKNKEGNLVDLSTGPEVVEKMQDKKHIEHKKEDDACLSVYMGIAACREEMERKKLQAVINKIASRDLYGCGDRGDAGDSIPNPEQKEEHLIGGETRLASDRDELGLENASRMTGEENAKGGGNGSIAPELRAALAGMSDVGGFFTRRRDMMWKMRQMESQSDSATTESGESNKLGDNKEVKQGDDSDCTRPEEDMCKCLDQAKDMLKSSDQECPGEDSDKAILEKRFKPSMEGMYIVKTRRGYSVRSREEDRRRGWRRLLCCAGHHEG